MLECNQINYSRLGGMHSLAAPDFSGTYPLAGFPTKIAVPLQINAAIRYKFLELM
jgi:hypothetical protein